MRFIHDFPEYGDGRFCLFNTDAGPETCDECPHVKPSLPKILRRGSMDGHPDICRPAQTLEAGRQDADYRIAFQIEVDRFAHNVWIRAESPLPQRMAKHSYEVPSWYCVFFRQERSTDFGRYA